MSSVNLDVYMPILILVLVAVVMFAGAILVGGLVARPNNPTELKESPYECGEKPEGNAWANFNVRFYVVALVFIIFDVESALMFPVASVFKKFVEMGNGGVILGTMLIFIGVLLLGVVYCWNKGDLDWVRSFVVDQDTEKK